MTIEQQKQTANKVYEMLTTVDPSCVLAGGAARDWYFGNEANDLDFYFCSTGSTVGRVEKQLKKVGLDAVASVCPQTSELYRSMEGLTRIWNCEVDGMKVQLIQMAEPKYRWNVVDNMDISICKVWYSQVGKIHLHKDFKLTIASGIMFLKDNYRWSDKHGQKMKERFERKFSCGTIDQARNSLVNKVLAEV
jgi:hypothetical protein